MMEKKKNKPMNEEQHVQKFNHKKIDQDFPEFPHLPAKKEIIEPANNKDKTDAGFDIEGENNSKQNNDGDKNNELMDESLSDGSGGAFDATENTMDDDIDTFRKNK